MRVVIWWWGTLYLRRDKACTLGPIEWYSRQAEGLAGSEGGVGSGASRSGGGVISGPDSQAESSSES